MRLTEYQSNRLRAEARKARAAGLDNDSAAERVVSIVANSRRPSAGVIGVPVVSGLTIAILCGDYS